MDYPPKSQVRTGLAAGGSRVRNIGPAVEKSAFWRATRVFAPGCDGSERPPISGRDRRFESGFLQQRVCELSVPRRRTLVLVLGWSAIALSRVDAARMQRTMTPEYMCQGCD